MKTRMTELLGIKHPVMLAGMAFISLPKLVAAVSNAGGIGMLNCVAYTPGQIKDVIRQVKSLTDKPFGVNATLIFPNARYYMFRKEWEFWTNQPDLSTMPEDMRQSALFSPVLISDINPGTNSGLLTQFDS